MNRDEEATQALADAIGPLYDCAGLERWLKLSEKDVLHLTRDGQILSVKTLDGEILFPARQFGKDGSFTPRLDEVQRALGGTLSDWGIALWMLYAGPEDGLDAYERLLSGDAEGVIRDARSEAERLRH